jgi:hypothetical protein
MIRYVRRLLALAAVAVLGVLWFAGPALAQVAPNGDVSPDAPVSAYLTVNNALVLVITGSLIPVVNGLLLRPTNPAWVKVLVSSAFATAVHAFSQTVQDDGTAILTQEWFLGLAITIGTMVATYLGVWKPVVNPNATEATVIPIGDWLTPSRQRAA